MSPIIETDVLERARELQEYIAAGRIFEALEEFYAEDVVMQENLEEPCVGLAANVAREKEFLDGVKEWKRYEVKALAVDGDVALVESISDFTTTDGQDVHLEQVSRTRWRDGKIVHERFYHA